jgi:hypothetical protein
MTAIPDKIPFRPTTSQRQYRGARSKFMCKHQGNKRWQISILLQHYNYSYLFQGFINGVLQRTVIYSICQTTHNNRSHDVRVVIFSKQYT